MIVTCVLCDKKVQIDANSYLGKRLRNHPLATYMCKSCATRITEKTLRRKKAGLLRPDLYHQEEDGWS